MSSTYVRTTEIRCTYSSSLIRLGSWEGNVFSLLTLIKETHTYSTSVSIEILGLLFTKDICGPSVNMTQAFITQTELI